MSLCSFFPTSFVPLYTVQDEYPKQACLQPHLPLLCSLYRLFICLSNMFWHTRGFKDDAKIQRRWTSIISPMTRQFSPISPSIIGGSPIGTRFQLTRKKRDIEPNRRQGDFSCLTAGLRVARPSELYADGNDIFRRCSFICRQCSLLSLANDNRYRSPHSCQLVWHESDVIAASGYSAFCRC